MKLVISNFKDGNELPPTEILCTFFENNGVQVNVGDTVQAVGKPDLKAILRFGRHDHITDSVLLLHSPAFGFYFEQIYDENKESEDFLFSEHLNENNTLSVIKLVPNSI